MAGIDKIYGSDDQYNELRAWLTEHKPEALRHLYQEEYPNDWITRPISNFPEEIDMWLLDNCELDWVVSRLKEQYNK